MGCLSPPTLLAVNYFRQKGHDKFATGLAIGSYAFMLVHVLIIALLSTLIAEARDSAIVADLGTLTQSAIKSVIGMQIIFTCFIIILCLFAQRTTLYLEKQLFYRYLIGALAVCACAQFTMQWSITRSYVSIFDWMKGQCKQEPLEFVDGALSDSQYTYTQWHDYDFAYQLNDFLMDSNACPDELSYLNTSVQALSPCKAAIFEGNGLRTDHLDFIKFMEEKFAGQTANSTTSTSTESTYERLKGFASKYSSTMAAFETKQCQGFCQVPKHLMFRTDVPVDDSATGEPLTSCSVFLVGYIVALVQAFTTLCMWHAKVCLMHLTLAGVQYFKLPALTMSAEEKRMKQEKKDAKAGYKQGMALKDEKMRAAELKRKKDKQTYALTQRQHMLAAKKAQYAQAEGSRLEAAAKRRTEAGQGAKGRGNEPTEAAETEQSGFSGLASLRRSRELERSKRSTEARERQSELLDKRARAQRKSMDKQSQFDSDEDDDSSGASGSDSETSDDDRGSDILPIPAGLGQGGGAKGGRRTKKMD